MTEPPALGPTGHRRAAREALPSLGVAILTVSDTRTDETDKAGRLLREALARDGHRIVDRAIVKDDAEEVAAAVRAWLARDGVDVVVTTGGTGIARRDVTVAALLPFIAREIPGFGELFRWLSYQAIGAPAVLTGAFAGVAPGEPAKVIVALPGSAGAVELALDKLLLPELRHLVWEARR